MRNKERPKCRDPAPGACFVTKFISLAQVMPGEIGPFMEKAYNVLSTYKFNFMYMILIDTCMLYYKTTWLTTES